MLIEGYRVSVRDDGVGLNLIHHECEEILLFTENVSVETLVRISEEHENKCEVLEAPGPCAACGKDPAEGYASRWTAETGTQWLCHPDEGESCYGGGFA